jgi:hypothetical protein
MSESRVTYADVRPYVVPTSLRALRGPSAGITWLPTHLAWSGQRRFNLDYLAEARHYVQVVLREAASLVDLSEHLDEAMVRRFWRDLFLPSHLRAAYESAFPDLRAPSEALMKRSDR